MGIVARLAFHEEAESTMTKEERLTEESVDVMRQAVTLLKSDAFGPDKQPAGSSGKEEVFSIMELTKEDLAATISEGVSAGVVAALQKSEEDRLARKAAKKAAEATAPVVKEEAPEAKPDEEEKPTEPVVKAEGEPSETPDIAALLKGAVQEAISPLADRLEKLEGSPQEGGPLVGAGGGGKFTPGQRGVTDPAITDAVTQKAAQLRSQIQKAEADDNPTVAQRLRNELGQEVLSAAFKGMGYDQPTNRPRTPQFIANAAS